MGCSLSKILSCSHHRHTSSSSNDEADSSKVDLRHFKSLRAVGEGTFCKVRIVQKKSTGQLYALKYIPKDRFSSTRLVENILRERRILEYLSPHPFLVNMRYAFQDDDNIYMVVDLMLGGDLRFFLNKAYSAQVPVFITKRQITSPIYSSPKNGKLIKLTRFKIPELILQHFMSNCCIAIHYLHTKGIIHRDIKPNNLLIDSFGFVHLSDFNVSGEVPSDGSYLKNRSGTVAYMAPEILRKTGYRTSVDWWSLGVVMYECMFGKRPFEGASKLELTKAIVKGQYPIVKGKYSSACVDFMQSLLTMNPKRRLGFEDENHYSCDGKLLPFCNCFELGDGCRLEEENADKAAKVCSFQKIMRHEFFSSIDWNKMKDKLVSSPYRPNPSSLHFDLIHEVNSLFIEKKELKYRKPKRNTRTSHDEEKSRLHQILETEFKDYYWKLKCST